MKSVLLLLIFTVLCSCNDRKREFRETSKIPLRKATASDGIEINANFPFGCADLKKYEYPKNWESDTSRYGALQQPEGRQFEEISTCFQKINEAAAIKQPEFEDLQFVKIGNDFRGSESSDRKLQRAVQHCKYRLSDIGIYECYYAFERDATKYGAYGNLILRDPKTETAKVLNVYFEGSGDSSTLFRYFLVDENAIHIYEGACYDDGCGLDEKFAVSIDAKGQIAITEIRKR